MRHDYSRQTHEFHHAEDPTRLLLERLGWTYVLQQVIGTLLLTLRSPGPCAGIVGVLHGN